MTYQHLFHAVDERVATIRLNRPELHSTLSPPLVDGILAAVAVADADPEVRVLVVTRAGRSGGQGFPEGGRSTLMS